MNILIYHLQNKEDPNFSILFDEEIRNSFDNEDIDLSEAVFITDYNSNVLNLPLKKRLPFITNIETFKGENCLNISTSSTSKEKRQELQEDFNPER